VSCRDATAATVANGSADRSGKHAGEISTSDIREFAKHSGTFRRRGRFSYAGSRLLLADSLLRST
jgi:hypothetical protein